MKATRRGVMAGALALLMAALLSLPLLPQPAGGIAVTSIAIDGDMGDWVPVLSDPSNAAADRAGADDPDDPGTSSRDLSLTGFTWDATSLFFYFRRTTTGTNSLTYNVYIDTDNNGLLTAADMIVRYTFNGTNYTGATLRRYLPVNPAGDTLGGDGVRPPGTEGAVVAGAALGGVSAANGIEMECRISWASLGLAAGSPISLHFATGRNSGLPGAIEDNTGNVTTRYRGVTIAPDNDAGAKAGVTVEYAHTITNTGNTTEVFDVSVASSQGWPVSVRLASGGGPISEVTLAGGEAASVIVAVPIPAGTPNTTRDVTVVRAACRADLGISAQAKDETMVGVLTVSPYRQGAIAQSGVISFSHTLSNNSTSAVVANLTATSDHGWPVGIYNAAGTTPLSSIALAPGASATIVCKLTVPAGAAIGTLELATVEAELASDPTVQGIAYDSVTVQKEVSIAPSNAYPGGAGTVLAYRHTVTNSWGETRTIDLTASSSQGWATSIYDANGTTAIGSVTLGPFGGSRTVFVRVAIPAAAPSGTVDVTTVRAVYGSVSDATTDTTTVSKLALYDTPGYVIPTTVFEPGGTVYARAMGLTKGSQVRFRWTDPNGAVVFTSPPIAVDVSQVAGSSYSLPAGAVNGTWACALLDNAGAEIASVAFGVNVPQYLSLTLDTPSLDFGSLEPATPAPPRVVGVTVNSSAPYTISRSLSAGSSLLGLGVAGSAVGVQPKGWGFFFDSYQVNIPWTTDPDVPVSASVVYTVTQ